MNPIDPKTTADMLTAFIKDAFAKAGFARAVIGVSGGVDSATSLALAVRALGAENVAPVILPYGALGTQGVLDAMELVTKFGIPLTRIVKRDIKAAVEAIIAGEPGMDDVRRGNIMARVRMSILFDVAKKQRGLVVGTENKSEHLLGYFTRFGDEASDIEPLRNIYKTGVYALAEHLGVTEAIRTKAPSADLWAGQTDEGEMGFSYADADRILAMLYDEGKSEADVVAAGVAGPLVSAVKRRVAANAFKHTLPLIP